MKAIDDILNGVIKEGSLAGASYAIVHVSGYMEIKTLGYFQTHPKKIKNKSSVIYDVASLTKVISTTTMIMSLIEGGRLSLKSKIKDILDRFIHPEITIYHLMTHTSGLPADIPRAKTLKSKDEVLDKVFSAPLISPVGETIVYSDIGYILLGLIIEKITGRSLDEVSQELIFKPLGMKHTGYHPKASTCAPTEYRNDDVYQGYLQGLVHDEKAFAMGGEAGHAGLFSTTKDIARFMLAILRKEFVLSNHTLDMLFMAQEKRVLPNENVLIRALGWDKPTMMSSAGSMVSFDDTILHTGFTGCNMFMDRKAGVGFVLLSNDVHPSRETKSILKLRHEIANLVMSKREEYDEK
jgi:CubicO group peptidase (beta-lactamase class C family)